MDPVPGLSRRDGPQRRHAVEQGSIYWARLLPFIRCPPLSPKGAAMTDDPIYRSVFQYVYVGVNAQGLEEAGDGVGSITSFVHGKFGEGWKSLSVAERSWPDVEVAGIRGVGLRPGSGFIWWADM